MLISYALATVIPGQTAHILSPAVVVAAQKLHMLYPLGEYCVLHHTAITTTIKRWIYIYIYIKEMKFVLCIFGNDMNKICREHVNDVLCMCLVRTARTVCTTSYNDKAKIRI